MGMLKVSPHTHTEKGQSLHGGHYGYQIEEHAVRILCLIDHPPTLALQFPSQTAGHRRWSAVVGSVHILDQMGGWTSHLHLLRIGFAATQRGNALRVGEVEGLYGICGIQRHNHGLWWQ